MAFVHLHVHSAYSLLDGAAKPRDLARKAAELGMEALALTDHGNMSGAVEFYKACRESGVKPIIGCEVYVAPRSRHGREAHLDDNPHHLILLAKSEEGYRNLVRLSSLAHLEGFYYKPRVDRELLAQYSGGLVALSACLGGEVPRRLLAGDLGGAQEACAFYRDIFSAGNFYLEMQSHGLPAEQGVNQALADLSRRLAIPLVATNDVHYLRREDAEVQDALLCIGTGKTLEEEGRLRFQGDQYYFKTAAQMYEAIPIQAALEQTGEIAQKCSFDFRFGEIHLPEYHPPAGEDADVYLAGLCRERLNLRYAGKPVEAESRLDYELNLIGKMGFASYFLIVWDFVAHAKKGGIPVGPGRGSAAGSIVAYLLGITDIDPLRYGLLFERFLNPERISMPDMDIDFCYARRGEVIDYVVSRYGKDRVSQIITFGTMAARAAIRDVGRVLQLPYGEVDRIAKLVPEELGITLERALETTPELAELASGGDPGRRLIRLAKAIEGLPRHASVHAAGVLISKDPLMDQVPLQKTNDGSVVSQYPMGVLEELGLLKMDFLGLRTLTVMEDTVKQLARRGVEVNWRDLPLDDEATYHLLGEGDTMGVFQLESSGMREMLREMKPSRVEDIMAAVSLYRPGPMENIPAFNEGKHGGKISYPHPDLEPILRETYGILVYQEQIMQVASQMAGFSMGQADLLRRAMGKKKREILEREKEHFIQGCLEKGHPRPLAEDIYELILKFANYGFNKSHGAAYGLLAYQTAYLKATYPYEYTAALLSSLDNSEKVAAYIAASREAGIAILPPDINESQEGFSVAGGKIRFGLAGVKNLGDGAAARVIAARAQGGAFASFSSFLERLGQNVLNRRAVESLVKAGAFTSLGYTRRGLIQALADGILSTAQAERTRRAAGQLSFFDAGTEVPPEVIPDLPEYPPKDLLDGEKEVLGLYLSGHPLDNLAEKLPLHLRGKTANIADLGERPDDSMVTLAGIVAGIKRVTTRKKEPMAFVTVEDLTGRVEMVVFPGTLRRYASLLETDKLLAVRGKVDRQEDSQPKLLAEEISLLQG